MQPHSDAEQQPPAEPPSLFGQRAARTGDGATGSAAARDERMAFLALAAHELRSPLTTVKGYAQLLLRGAANDPNTPAGTTRALRTIEQQVTRMADMVGTLLDASRIAAGTFELRPAPADLRVLVRRVVDRVAAGLDERHQLRLENDGGDALPGEWDGPRTEQVLRDLLDNAVRFSPGGGLVLVRVARAGHMGRVRVADAGIGIPADERPRLHEPFFRGAMPLERNLSGLGLGLYVCQEIATRQGGRLWLESSATSGEQHGSVFVLDLPLLPTA
jgi:signal transduction histidine kinase